jgi:hypothetical protein
MSQRLWGIYLDASCEADVVAVERDDLYRAISRRVVEIIERAHIQPPGDYATLYKAMGRAMAWVEAGPTTLLLMGSTWPCDSMNEPDSFGDYDIMIF